MVVLTSFTQPTDGIRHRQNNTTVYVNDNNIGKGTLFIAESCLSWVSDAGNGFSLEYPHISLHAVSRDLSAFPQECLFLMLDTALGDEEAKNGNGENGDNGNESGSEGETTELRLVPDDRGMLDAMFHAMNVCQALHPDPEDSFSDEDFYEDADDEIPMEEADYRMAGLRIESTDGRPHIGRVAADMEEDTEEDMEEDMEEDTVVVGMPGIQVGVPLVGGRAEAAGGSQGEVRSVGGRVAGAEGSRGEVRSVAGRGAGAGGSRAAGDRAAVGVVGREVDMVEGRVEGKAVDTLDTSAGDNREVDMVEGRAVGTWGDRAVDMVEGKVEGRVEGRAVDTWGDRVVGMVEGRAVDRAVDRGVDREVDTWGGKVGGRAVGTLGTSAGDRVVGTLDTAAVGRVGDRVVADMGRDGRSFSSGSIWHRGTPGLPPLARSPHTAPLEDHNFDDAEN